MRNLIRLAVAASAAVYIAGTAAPAAAQAFYTINGLPAPYDAARFMASHGLPPGNYWLDAFGNWGVVGFPRPLGNIYASAPPQRHRSLSERGLLYSPGEILSGR